MSNTTLDNTLWETSPFLGLTPYKPGYTTLTSVPSVVGMIAGYLVTVFGLQKWMENKQPMKLVKLMQVYNLAVSVGSLALVVGMASEVIPNWKTYGFFYTLCDERALNDRLRVYYLINYYFKYVEFIDTVFMALRKRPLTFLHVYHHTCTALFCRLLITGNASLAWAPVGLNVSVHVVMYYYFYASADGRKIWWKKYLTLIQIIQFVIDMFLLGIAGYSNLTAYYTDLLPKTAHGACAGGSAIGFSAAGMLGSYLVLFSLFYRNSYKKPKKDVKKSQ